MKKTLLLLLALSFAAPQAGSAAIYLSRPHNPTMLIPAQVCLFVTFTIVLAPIGGLCLLGEELDGDDFLEAYRGDLLDRGYTELQAHIVAQDLHELGKILSEKELRLLLQRGDTVDSIQSTAQVYHPISRITAKFLLEEANL